MLKKIISSFLVFTLIMTANFDVRVVSADDDVILYEQPTRSETVTTFDTYMQTKTILAENSSDVIQRLTFCEKNTDDLTEEINNSLLESFKLKEAKDRIDFASAKANTTIETLNEKKKKEAEVGQILYHDIRTNLNEEFLLAVIIFCEAGNQSYEGKVAVGNVVLNRMASPKFANTIEGVIRQKGQFEPVWTGWYDKELAKGVVNDSCMQAAKDALNGVNIVGDCLFFHRTKGYDPGIILGDHVFY